jgi:6-phosphogluconolactonase (cycloisomerase 2 family)
VTAFYVRKTGVNTNGGTSPTVRSTGTDGHSNSNTTFTAASASWTSADIGHYIQVNTTTVSIRKIVAVPDGQTLTLDSALGTTQTGRTWTVGGAFLTLQKAVFDLKTVNGAPASAQGDVVYVGPGDYRSDAFVVGSSPGQTGLVLIQGDYEGDETGDAPGEIQLSNADLQNATALEIRNVSFYGSGVNIRIGNAAAGNVFRFIDCAFISAVGATTGFPNSSIGLFNVLLGVAAQSMGEILIDRCYFSSISARGGSANPSIYIGYNVSGTTTEFSLAMTVRNTMILHLRNASPIQIASSNGATGADSAIKLSDLTVTHCTFITSASDTGVAGVLQLLSTSGKVTGVPTRNWKFFYNVGIVAGAGGEVYGNITTGQITENNNVWAANKGAAPVIGANVTAGGNTSLLATTATNYPWFLFGQERTYGQSPKPFGTPVLGISTAIGLAAESTVASAAEDATRASRPSSAKVAITSGALEIPIAARETSTVRTGANALRLDQSGSQEFLLPVNAGQTTISVYARYDSNYAAFKFGNQVAPPQVVQASAPTNIAVHPTGRWIAIVGGTNNILVYALDPSTGAIGARRASPATMPAGGATHAQWNPAGTYLAVASTSSPFIEVYPFDPATGAISDKVANPGTLPTGAGNSVAWSPDGAYVAVTHTTSPFISAYPFSTSFGTKVADPGTLPAGIGRQVAWNPAGTCVAVAHDTSPFVTAWPWSAGFGTKVADPGTLPSAARTAIAWSPDGSYVGVVGGTTPFIEVYPFTTGFGAKVADPGTLPSGSSTEAGGIQWTASGNYVVRTSNSSAFVEIWPWSAGFGTKVADPGTVLGGLAGGLGIVGKGKFIFSQNESAAATAYSTFGYRFNHAPTMSVKDGLEIGVADAETQMVGAANQWEQLSLVFTATAAGFVTVRLAAPGSPGSTTGKAFFDDFAAA